MEYYAEKGADKSKLVMGIPTYGQSFTLHDQSNTGLNSPASKGSAGKYTRAAGFLAYNEVTQVRYALLSRAILRRKDSPPPRALFQTQACPKEGVHIIYHVTK